MKWIFHHSLFLSQLPLLLFAALIYTLLCSPQIASAHSQTDFEAMEEIMNIENNEREEREAGLLNNPVKYFERKKEKLAQDMALLSNTLDSLFGGEDFDIEAKSKSRIKITYGQQFEEYEDPIEIFDFSARIALPNTEKKFHLLLESFNEEGLEQKNSSPVTSSKRKQGAPEERQYNAGLRYIPFASDLVHLNVDTGVSLVWPPQPFVKLRARKTVPLFYQISHKLLQRIAWYNEEGWETHSKIAFERPFSGGKYISFSTDILWRDVQNYSDLSNTLSFFHPLTNKNYLTYWAGTLSEISRGVFIKTYELGVSFRRPIYKNWVIFQISPIGRWQKENRFTYRSVLEAKIEIVVNE